MAKNAEKIISLMQKCVSHMCVHEDFKKCSYVDFYLTCSYTKKNAYPIFGLLNI